MNSKQEQLLPKNKYLNSKTIVLYNRLIRKLTVN